ncbi:MAG: methylenetetrahydrofolate--tRNA-(uracil(54)-C(5))-methyltransferase (FADH(2)-oxidizing) TrmFO, partial [Bdellovibrio sp.]
MQKITVVGAGLAGTECTLQLAQMGFQVDLIEMRGVQGTPSHKTERVAELVCSNSFVSLSPTSAPGLVKNEARAWGSFILAAAEKAQVPAGQALGVDREQFSSILEEQIQSNPRITMHRNKISCLEEIPRPAVVATGPLTDSSLADSLQSHFGLDFLFFFDAIAPVIDADSINRDIVFAADRYGKGQPDYLNCPLNKVEYEKFIEEVEKAEKITPKHFETTAFFEGCMPIEEMLRRGRETLRYGP